LGNRTVKKKLQAMVHWTEEEKKANSTGVASRRRENRINIEKQSRKTHLGVGKVRII